MDFQGSQRSPRTRGHLPTTMGQSTSIPCPVQTPISAPIQTPTSKPVMQIHTILSSARSPSTSLFINTVLDNTAYTDQLKPTRSDLQPGMAPESLDAEIEPPLPLLAPLARPTHQGHQQVPRQNGNAADFSTHRSQPYCPIPSSGTTPRTEAGTMPSSDHDLRPASPSDTLLPKEMFCQPAMVKAAAADRANRGRQSPRGKITASRVQIAAACLACRKRKAKCNGARPACARCNAQNLPCAYDSDPNSTRMLTLKRRQQILESEVDDLRRLFYLLQTWPELNALEILWRIRNGDDDGGEDGLGHSSSGGMSGNDSGGSSDYGRHHEEARRILKHVQKGDLVTERALTQGGLATWRIDREASARPYAIAVPAQPWTIIAGNGLVSELVGAFFTLDSVSWLPFVDREAFVADMRAARPDTARYCSTLLVHAMCALRASTSPRAKALGAALGCDVAQRFFDEAKIIFDKELGRSSLPTAWALVIMFMCLASWGRDSAGMMYRLAAFRMLETLRLPQQLRVTEKSGLVQETQLARRVFSRALWGMYACDSYAAFLYLSTATFARPAMPRIFLGEGVVPGPDSRRFPDDSPFCATVLGASCDLADIYNVAMAHNRAAYTAGTLGTLADVQRRLDLFRDLRMARAAFPAEIVGERRWSTASFYLNSFADQIILAIFRPVPHATPLPNMPDIPFKFEPPMPTVGDACIAACAASIARFERLESDFSLRADGYSGMVLYPLYNAGLTLLGMLARREVRAHFVRLCVLLAAISEGPPLAAYTLKAIQAMAVRMGVEIPGEATPAFVGLRQAAEEGDALISFVVPEEGDFADILCGNATEYTGGGSAVEIGVLISKWSALGSTQDTL